MGKPINRVFERKASATKTPLLRLGSFRAFATSMETARQMRMVSKGTSSNGPISSMSARFKFFWIPTIVLSGTAILMT